MAFANLPFALSLSKGRSFPTGVRRKDRGFDRLSPNGKDRIDDGPGLSCSQTP